MCGIIGYVGIENSVPKLIDGLKALEYRGYDSAGIAVFTDGGITTVKAKGRIANIEELLKKSYSALSSSCGIGHTRWATHGEPSDINSHPHGTERLRLVHNGIIENYIVLKKELMDLGYTFESETDTEIASKLVDLNYKETSDCFAAVKKSLEKLQGSYALGIIFKDVPGKIFATRKDSPLIIAVSESGNFIASDIPAVLKYTNKYYQLEQGEIAIVEKDKVTVYGLDGQIIEKKLCVADWDIDAAEKGGWDHFMIKEINEEPDSIIKTIRPRVVNGLPNLQLEELSDEKLASFKNITMVACGTAMHAGLIGKTAIERLARIPVKVEIASEFRYKNPIITKDDLVIIISQSGETADTLAALRLAKERGAYTLAIVNVAGSSIAREADSTLYTWAGPEIAVASTKAYTVQISVMYLIAVKLALSVGKITEEEAKNHMRILLEHTPVACEQALLLNDECKRIADKYKDSHDLFFIGRGIDYDIAVEASLKLKEISYIHSEAYAAGELKHGTISLITTGTPVIAVCTEDELYDKMISNIKEVKARGAKVIMICKKGAKGADDVADDIFYIPELEDGLYMPIPAMTVLQLISYYTSVLLDLDVDKPRNLAKSVTVE
ncbi:MAG: glutamine--fructose-6-phosphate transaminase (isomerizing) [Ruminococcaceae bacterium]|nr:glutamine--fructose-6-phosphate transaminase (isomerizing) [Oscillospiraceae bacterium]